MPLEPGTKLGQYEVVSSLGAGGMGEVYRARDTKLGREVAIKLLLEEVSADPERLARFEREARVLGSLNHPNIATLHGFESDGDTSFLVMELVEGETLADRIARGPIPVDEAIPLFVSIAKGLEAAHEQGVIHRDLKPANIKFDARGGVKVLDFGLAKAVSPEVELGKEPVLSQSPTMPLGATQQGQILGTAAYMSPEQAKGRGVDQRSDLWSFGVCLYEALTGGSLFAGEDASETLASVLRKDPDLDRLPSSTPIDVRNVVRKCLRRDVERRMQHAGDARIDLEDATTAPDVALPDVARGTRRTRVELFAALILGGFVAAVATWTLKPTREASDRPVTRAVFSAGVPVRGVGTPIERDLAMTRDGRQVVYRNGDSLYVRDADRLEGYELEGTRGVRAFFLSPDGAWVGFSTSSALKRVSILGGPAETLCQLPDLVNGATWAPDDNIVFGSLSKGLYRVSVRSGELEQIAAPNPETETAYRFPELLPDGDTLLFTIFTSANVEEAKIVALSLADGTRKTLLTGGSDARYVETGHLVYGLRGTLRAVRFDAENLQVLGNPVPVLEGVATTSHGASNVAFSKRGTLVYVAGGPGGEAQARLVWVGRDGTEEAIGAPPRNYHYPRVSPDGRRIAASSRDEDRDVWIWDLDRQSLQRLTVDPGQDMYAVWTYDGSAVIFTSSRNGSFDLYSKTVDGTGAVKQLTDIPEFLYPASISPDGKSLVYRAGSTAYDLGVLEFDGDVGPKPLIATEFLERNADVSPDGRWLAYETDEPGEPRIYVSHFPDVARGRFPVSASRGTEPRWSPSGNEIFFRAGDAMMSAAVRTDPGFESDTPRELFNRRYAARTGRMYDVSPDGQRFLMIKIVARESELESQVIVVENWFEELERLVPSS